MVAIGTACKSRSTAVSTEGGIDDGLDIGLKGDAAMDLRLDVAVEVASRPARTIRAVEDSEQDVHGVDPLRRTSTTGGLPPERMPIEERTQRVRRSFTPEFNADVVRKRTI